MKNLFISIFILLSISNSIALERISRLDESRDDHVPTYKERESNDAWKVIFDTKVEIFAEGKTKSKWQSFKDNLDPTLTENLADLAVREIHVIPKQSIFNQDSYTVPMAFDLKYYENILQQGTANILGEITINRGTGDFKIKLKSYSMSQKPEEHGRNFGLHKRFDEEYMETVSCKTILKLFNESDPLNELEKIMQTYIKNNS